MTPRTLSLPHQSPRLKARRAQHREWGLPGLVLRSEKRGPGSRLTMQVLGEDEQARG